MTDTGETPGGCGHAGKGISAAERQLLMVDDDRDAIMYERDSAKLGKYIIE